MPQAALRPCRTPNCPELVVTGHCVVHKPQADSRPTAAQRGYGYRWQLASKAWLSRPENALCVDCKAEKRVRAATDVDHEIPHKGDMVLFWDQTNWRGRCHSHHSAKTARENGGFGNRIPNL